MTSEHRTAVKVVLNGGFAYLPDAGRSFSRGVIALDGYVFRRVHLRRGLPLEAGLRFAAEFIRAAGRPMQAFCGCELRIPTRLSRTGFAEFNRRSIAALGSSGFEIEPVNPAARTNMAPAIGAPTDAALAAFTFAVPSRSSPEAQDFLISGKPELASNPDRVIATGDISSSGMQEKAAFVLEELQLTVRQLGGYWDRVTAGQIYTRHSIGDLEGVFASAGLPLTRCTHIPGDPPVFGPDGVPLEFEVDVRSITVEETA